MASFAGLIACMGAAWQPSSAQGQESGPEEDTQLWVYAIAQVPLEDDFRLTVDGTLRWREAARGDEQQTLRFNLDRTIAPGARLGGGFGVFESEGGATELRPHQQLTWRAGGLATRTRFEQRLFDGADRVELRFRQRVGYTQPLANDWSASGEVEFLHLLQRRNRMSNAARDQWRGRLIVSHDVSERFRIGGAYLVIWTPRPGARDRINHVPQILLTQEF